ncbi:MAG TPA: M56 family metallopeptidase [Myxococcaceae bacterium]|nr:M56 family metallopeptidase [Myxococcaceae bacterium]
MNAATVGTLLSLAATLGAAWLLTYAVHSTALIGSVWLAERAGFLRSLRLRDLAWRTALVGALFTATLQLAAGLTPFGGAAELTAPALPADVTAAPETPRHPAPAIPATEAPRAVIVPVPAVPVARAMGSAGPASASPDAPTTGHSVAVPRLSPAGLAFLGWAVVASAFLLRLAVLRARLLTALGDRAPVVDPLVRARLEGLCADVGHARPVRLTTAEGLRSPVAMGWSEICLPAEALLELDGPQQRSVLAHELAHLRRFDPVWLVVGSVLEQLFFFQPLNRLARARMQEVAEFLCDDWAAARNGSGLDVARGLASVAAWVDGRATSVPMAGMAEHPSQLLARVTRLLERGADEVDRLRPWHVGGMALLLLLTVFIAPGVRAGPSPHTRGRIAVQSLDREVLDGPLDDAAPGGEAPPPDGRATRTPPPVLAFADPMPPAAPRAPVPPVPPKAPTPPTATDIERIRRDAQRIARDAQLRAHDAVHRAHARTTGHGRHGGGRTPADPKTVDALIGALKDGDPGVRQAAAESLGRLGEPRAVDALSGLLGDANVEVRRSAVEALGNIEDSRALPALTRAAGDASPAVRREAAEALLSFDEPAAGEPLIKLLGDSDARVRLTAMEGLSQRGDRRALSPLSKLVKDPNVEIRARAVRALSRFQDPAAQEGLLAALKDENAEVRAAAAAGLGELELKSAPQGLLDATRDPSAEVRQQAAETLGQIRDPKAVPQLKALLEDSDADVRGSAVEALSDIRDGAALQALIAAMQSKDVTVRRAAAQALGQRD